MMFSIPSVYEIGGTWSDSYDIVQGALSSCSSPTHEYSDHNNNQNPNYLSSSPRAMAEAKAMAASNSHKEAERRRRKRINAHIATLKSILPNTIKTDKASLLGEAVRRVKELKKAAAEVGAAAKVMVPSETDEVKVCRCEKSGLMKATVCCDDRPEIMVELTEALRAAEAKVVRAEMSTVGGRTKSVLWVEIGESDVVLGTLRRALRMVMDRSTFLAGSGQGNKRPRYSNP